MPHILRWLSRAKNRAQAISPGQPSSFYFKVVIFQIKWSLCIYPFSNQAGVVRCILFHEAVLNFYCPKGSFISIPCNTLDLAWGSHKTLPEAPTFLFYSVIGCISFIIFMGLKATVAFLICQASNIVLCTHLTSSKDLVHFAAKLWRIRNVVMQPNLKHKTAETFTTYLLLSRFFYIKIRTPAE